MTDLHVTEEAAAAPASAAVSSIMGLLAAATISCIQPSAAFFKAGQMDDEYTIMISPS